MITKLSRPPSLCHQCIPAVFLGLINTCCNRNGSTHICPTMMHCALLTTILYYCALSLCQTAVYIYTVSSIYGPITIYTEL